MSVSINKKPGTVELSGARLLVKVLTNSEFSVAGIEALEDISFSQVPFDGQEWTLIWGAGEVTFTFKSAPLGDQFHIPLPTSFFALDVWIETTLIDAMNKCYELRRDFVLTRPAGTNTLRITAREKGELYNLNFDGNPSHVSYTLSRSGIDRVRRENYRLTLNLLYAGYNDEDYRSTDMSTEPVNSIGWFDLADVLKYSHNKKWPSFGGVNALQDSSEIVLKYIVYYGEASGEPLVYGPQKAIAEQYLLPGGRSLHNQRKYATLKDYWMTPEPKWLSYRSSRKVTEGEPCFLYYMPDSTQAISFMLTLIYTDGTSELVTLATANVEAYGLWAVDVSYARVVALANNTKVLKRWQVAVADQATTPNVISDMATLTLDTDAQLDELYLAYRNGLGVPDFYRCRGEQAKFTDFVKTAAKLFKLEAILATDRESAITESELVDTIQVNVGHQSQAEMELLKDVLNSKEYYVVMSGEYIPVRLETGTLGRGSTRSDSINDHSFILKLDPEKYV